MKLITKLLAVAGLIGTGILVERWRHQRLARLANDQGAELGADDVDALGTISGISDVDIDVAFIGIAEVDPQPMTQISGEGIDPDMPVPPRAR